MTTTAVDLHPIRDMIQEEMERLGVPGAAVGISVEGGEAVAGFGVTSVEQPLPVTSDTIFQIGSISKTITATTVMRLVEEGSIALDERVRAYLPQFRVADSDASERVTVRHLLQHTAGWEGDIWEDTGRGDDALERMVSYLADRPQVTPLGAVWSYNNAAFYILGRIGEVVTGKPYETVASDRVLDPLDMTRSFYFPEEAMTYRFACGHVEKDGKPDVYRPWQWPRAGAPVGRLKSTVPDLLRFARFHLGDGTSEDGTPLLSPQTMRLMQEPAVSASNGGFVGLSWFIGDVGGLRTVSHGGSTAGQVGHLLMAPERGFAVVVLTNASTGGVLAAGVVDRALEVYAGVTRTQDDPLDLDPDEMVPYTGRYERESQAVEIRIEERTLVAQVIPLKGILGEEPPPAQPPLTLAVLPGDRVSVLDGPFKGITGEFVRNEEGAITWLRLGGRITTRQA